MTRTDPRETLLKLRVNRWLKRGLLIGMIVVMQLSGCSQDTSAQYSDGLYISEVVSSNSDSLTDAVYGSPDWIELYNASDNAISLENYSIYESTGNRYTFPSVEIGAQSYLVIYCCAAVGAADEAAVSADGTAPAQVTASPEASAISTDSAGDTICTGFRLSKEGMTLTLASAGGTLQELTVPSLETDISYGYREDGAYGYFIQSTPGLPNSTPSFATMEELRSGEQTGLVISEILPKDVSDAEPYAWVELYNAGAAPVMLSNYYISENLSNLKKASLPAIELAAGQYAVIKFTDQAGEDTVPFKIGSDETTVAVSDSLGLVVDRVTWDADILPGISAGHGEGDRTIYFTLPTPGAANSADFLETTDISLTEGLGAVYMTELLVNNTFSVIDQFGERSPWVELYNSSAQPVTLSDYALSDDPESLWKWNLPAITIEPDSYIIVYLSGKDQKTGELHTNFKLGDADEALYLTNLVSQTVQTITLPAENKDNVSYGISPDAQWLFYPQPTPMSANTTQGFLEIAGVSAESAGVSINEVATVSDARDGECDWVELYNGSSSAVDLSGYYLSDSKNDITKWPIGSVSIRSGGYEVIDEYQQEGGAEALTIALSGETLYLFSPQGLLLDQFEAGVLRPGISCGIYGSGAEKRVVFFGDPTPGGENGVSVLGGYCAAPMFSVPGGYQTGAVTLEMATSTEGGVIYYTTDGSTPTKGSAQYIGPVTISSTQAVRAITVADGRITSEQTVATYLFEDTHSLPVICLSMTKSDLSYIFGSATRSDVRERAGYVEYYEAGGILGVSFPAGFRIAGAGTRTYAQKSINLYLRGGYGRSSVTYPFFGDYDITTFTSLSLRNMGQDRTMSCLRDAYFHTVTNGLNILNMQTKFAVVYINGEYWGLYEFKENQNEEYLASKFGIDPDLVEMVRSSFYAYEGSSTLARQLLAIAKSSIHSDASWEEYLSLIDVDYFNDYLIVQTYICNSDYYNQKYTHTSDNSLTWRPMFYDLDWGFRACNPRASAWGFFDSDGIILGTDSLGAVNSFVDTGLFYALYCNDEWRSQFVARYAQVMDSVLSTEHMLEVYDEMVASIEDEMPRHIARWGAPSSISRWEDEAADLRDCIANRRPYAIDNLQSFFDLSDEEIATLFPNG